jgi:cystathionine beta-lyase/cystathionine gamma-synthase
MDRHNENAQKVAEFFEASGAADRVYYPGLKSDPGYELQKSQASGNGAVLSVDLNEKYDLTVFCNSLEYFDLAVSLGGVESLVCHPASMTHEEYTDEEQAAIGLGKRLLRFSVGIEDAEDLIGDIRQALEKAEK